MTNVSLLRSLKRARYSEAMVSNKLCYYESKTDPKEQDMITEQLSFAKSSIEGGCWAELNIPLFCVIILLFIAIFAALIKWATYHVLNLSIPISPGSTVSRRSYEEVVNGFLRDISFQAPNLEFDTGLKLRVENRLQCYGVSQKLITEIEPCIDTATKISSFTYPFFSHGILEAIALYATYVIAIDDTTSEILPDLEAYCSQLVSGQSQRHELLRGFTKFLGDKPRLFGKFGGDMIIKGTLEFIAAAVIEHNQKNVHLPCDAYGYLPFFRAKTGVAEPFAFFCFPEDTDPEDGELGKYICAIPDIMLFLGYVNDLLSFYKEEIKEEDCPGFVQNYVMVHSSTSLHALRQLRHETTKKVRKIRSILASDRIMAKRLDQFVNGYIFYHLCAERYRLDELNIPAAHTARTHFHALTKRGKEGR